MSDMSDKFGMLRDTPFLRSPRTLAHGVAEDLRRTIRGGTMSGKMPSEPDLARQLGVSRTTVRHAISILENEGFVHRRQGLGTFVAATATELRENLNTNVGVTQMILAAGQRPGTTALRQNRDVADARLARWLGVAVGAPVLTIERTRTADDRPVAQTIDYLSLDLLERHSIVVDQLMVRLGAEQSLYVCLGQAGIHITGGFATIKAAVAEEELASTLQLTRGALLVHLEQIDHTAVGRPVLFSDEYLVPGELIIQVYRKGPA